MTLVFSATTVTEFQMELPRRGVKYTGWEKLAIFDWNRRLSRKWYE